MTVVGFNPAMDRVALVPSLRPGQVHRAMWTGAFAGGKGMNVARAVRRLGGEARVAGFAGGWVGAFLREECARLGIDCRFSGVAAVSRVCYILVEEGGRSTVVNEPGPPVAAAELAACRAGLEEAVRGSAVLVVTGSAPPGVPVDLYADMVDLAARLGIPCILDAGGEALRAGLSARPWLVKPNAEEARALLQDGAAFDEADACRALVERGARHVVLSLGARGALFHDGSGFWRLRPPRVATRNAVGSGDAFVAGLAEASVRGWSLVDALRLACTCGALNAAAVAPDLPEGLDLRQAAARSRWAAFTP